MASNLVKLQTKTIRTPNPETPFPLTKTHSFTSLLFPKHHRHSHLSSFPPTLLNKSKTPTTLSPLRAALSSSSSPTPPTSKAAAIQQAKKCLSTTLDKPLNNLRLTTNKLKKLKQPRFRIEIPVADDSSPESLTQLALELFTDLTIKKKGSPVNFALLWPDIASAETATETFDKAFPSSSRLSLFQHLDISNGNTGISNSADVAVFLAPEVSQVAVMKTVSDLVYPRPVVIFNPKWGFEDEAKLLGELSGFVGSFEVVYSFMGLEVKGLLSKRNGVIFRCVRDGVVSGEKWAVFVEEEQGELKIVSSFKSRPTIGEVEYVLYNLMAMNSPVTKSVKFFKDLVSNVTGGKKYIFYG